MSVSTTRIDQLSVNTIRTLSMDAVQQANSGHPGTPMALAPAAYTLWNRVLRFDPADPTWPGRDRFVLSCGHASMLLYSLLHLADVKQVGPDGRVSDEAAVSHEQIKRFRQMNSRTPGHPEHRHTSGVETTTGPLGQGIGNSVGMAIAGCWLAARYHRPGFELFDYNVYAFCSDGDLMEGVGAEAASLAGHLKLTNLCWVYDDNRITIEGSTDLAFSENVAMRFKGYGWSVISVGDANDLTALEQAYKRFGRTRSGPTLIIVRSQIAWGSPNMQNSHEAHGSPLGEHEIQLTKQAYGWPENEKFLVPDDVRNHFAENLGRRGRRKNSTWKRKFRKYGREYPALAEELRLIQQGRLPEGWEGAIPVFEADVKGMASRVSSGKVLGAVAEKVPWLIGGAADLAPSTKTLLSHAGSGDFSADNYGGCNFHWGIREHAMAAALNGMALSGLRPFGATFFVFTDYLRPSLRLAAMMRLPVFYVLTHDSIGVGEDGPTHQPVEHLAAARSIPGLVVLRPADANEVAVAYRTILSANDRPAVLVLTRQNLPTLDRTRYAPASGLARGAYVLSGALQPQPDVLLIGTGSEVSICLVAAEQLQAQGIRARVVSMPSWELFEQQDAAYRHGVLPPSVTARVAVEAGIEQGWHKYLGVRGRFVGMSGFGASAPYAQLYEHYGITANRVVEEAKASIAAAAKSGEPCSFGEPAGASGEPGVSTPR